MADIKISNLSKKYGQFDALKSVDLDIQNGEFVVFVGPSGSGKSTLLRAIGGLEDITTGSIAIGGQEVSHLDSSERELAMVFQNYALFPHMTVRQNMEFPLKMAGASAQETTSSVQAAAELLRMPDLLDRKPSELSGGQRQRVAIGRAIVKKPKVFLFDEPLSNLDAELRVQMRVEIAKLHRSLANTMIYVTHDQTEALTMADRIVVLKDGEIMQIGTPHELYYEPANRFVAGFIGSPQMNFQPCELVSAGSDSCIIRTLSGEEQSLPVGPLSAAPGTGLVLGVRPEHVALEQAAEESVGIDVTVDIVEHLGSVSYVYAADAAGEDFVFEAPESIDKRAGDTMRVWVAASACYLFSSDGAAVARRAVPAKWS